MILLDLLSQAQSDLSDLRSGKIGRLDGLARAALMSCQLQALRLYAQHGEQLAMIDVTPANRVKTIKAA